MKSKGDGQEVFILRKASSWAEKLNRSAKVRTKGRRDTEGWRMRHKEGRASVKHRLWDIKICYAMLCNKML